MSTKTQNTQLISDKQRELANQDRQIYDTYMRMIDEPNAMKGPIYRQLMRQFGYYSDRSVQNAIQREANRRQNTK